MKRDTEIFNLVKDKTNLSECLKVLIEEVIKIRELLEKRQHPDKIVHIEKIFEKGHSLNDEFRKSEISEDVKFIPSVDISQMKLKNDKSSKTSNIESDLESTLDSLDNNLNGDNL